MQLDRDMGHNSSSIEVRVLVGWTVGHAERSTLREIFHRIRVVGLRYIVRRRHILFGILVKEMLDNKYAYHQAFIIEMDGKLCDQVISILADPRSNYSYVSLDLVDKFGLSKELHA